MISINRFLECVKQNADRVTHYESGGDGSGGGCDCIGLIIGALRLAGEKWTGTHGSNWAARNAIQEPWPFRITGENDLMPGMIVFKTRRPGDSGYSLPDSYKSGSDQTDYYHVGVVTRVNPLTIMHCTKSAAQGIDGITEDHSIGTRSHYAKLKQVNYGGQEEKDETLYYAEVVASNGYPVKLRPQPNTDRDEICKVPLHSVVGVLDDSINGWDKIDYAGTIGYMMSSFLVPLDSVNAEKPSEPEQPSAPSAPTESPAPSDDTVRISRNELASMRRKLNEVTAWIDQKMEG